MRVIQVHLEDRQIEQAEALAVKLGAEIKVKLSRADIIRIALDQFIASNSNQEANANDRE